MGGQRKQNLKNGPIERLGCPGKAKQGLVFKLIFALCLGEGFSLSERGVASWTMFMGKGVGEAGHFFCKLFEPQRNLLGGIKTASFLISHLITI